MVSSPIPVQAATVELDEDGFFDASGEPVRFFVQDGGITVLRELHWLPIEKGVVFKTLLCTLIAIHQLTPAYILDLIEVHTPSHTLLSSSQKLLKVPYMPHRLCFKQQYSESQVNVCGTIHQLIYEIISQ